MNGVIFISKAAEDGARAARLCAQLAGEDFWCETCGRTHPLIEHRDCREPTHRKETRR